MPQEASNQPYQLTQSAAYGPLLPTLNIRWFAAGVPGDPWTMDREVSYTAQFSTPHVTIKKMDLETGKVLDAVTTYTWEPGSGTCPSARISVDVLRAHNVR